jgi:hypothetical protein
VRLIVLIKSIAIAAHRTVFVNGEAAKVAKLLLGLVLSFKGIMFIFKLVSSNRLTRVTGFLHLLLTVLLSLSLIARVRALAVYARCKDKPVNQSLLYF